MTAAIVIAMTSKLAIEIAIKIVMAIGLQSNQLQSIASQCDWT